MKKNKKKIIIALSILIVGIVLILAYLQFTNKIDLFSIFFKTPHKNTVVNVFGEPGSKEEHAFPANKPEFTATIGAIKPPSIHQQSISIFVNKDAKKTEVFKRDFYADRFHGHNLNYTLSSDSATFVQSGTLGKIGCNTDSCAMTWNNFYSWDPKQHTFILDNSSHKKDFEKLLSQYQELDTKGCNIINGDLIPTQSKLTFTEIYKKYPTLPSYCSKTHGILSTNLIFFLQAEAAIKEIIDGENVGSNDIARIQL